MVRCHLRDMSVTSRGITQCRKGRYHGSQFWDVDGFGKSRWVVGAYIELDEYPPEAEREDIVEECIAHLNSPPERKKYEKAMKEPLYGKLSVYNYTFRQHEGGKPYIEALLITDQRTNKHFWGKGFREMP